MALGPAQVNYTQNYSVMFMTFFVDSGLQMSECFTKRWAEPVNTKL